jgi:lysophospholipase L1-like esterase
VAKRVLTPLVVSVIALEIGLRLYNPLPFRIRGDRIFLSVHQSITLSHAGAKKLDPVTHVTKNSLGFRGPEPPRDWTRRLTVLAIGGSTTECLFLSDGKTWTDQLARRAVEIRPDIWINNAGVEGTSTFGHLVLLRDYVLAMRPTMAIFLIGVNDMSLGAASDMDHALNPQNLSVVHRGLTFVADHSEIGAVLENLARMTRTYRAGLGKGELRLDRTREVDPSEGEAMLAEHRSRYLAGYARRVTDIVQLCRRNHIEPVLMTQPALYGDSVDPTTGVLLATAAVQGVTNGHYQWAVLELYNDVTRRVAAGERVLLIDLARTLEKDSRYYIDWVHFSNDGARRVGVLVFEGLRPTLAAGTSEKR